VTAAASPAAEPVPWHAELVRVWPDHGRGTTTAAAAGAAAAGLAAALLLPGSAPGLGVVMVGVLVAATALSSARGRLGPHEMLYGGLATLLLAVVALRDAAWFVSLCLVAAAALASYALSPARTVVGALFGGLSLPLAAVRGLPWASRGLRAHLPAAHRTWLPALRAVVASVTLVLVFGALFASADAAFAALLPTIDPALLPVRVTSFVAVGGLAGCAAFLAAAPPRWDALAVPAGRRVRPLEWVAPIALLDALFGTFVAVQLTVLVGGHDHVLRTAGLTYAEYARSGFGQLVVVTLLTLSVVAAAARWAPRDTAAQRATLRALLGTLCALTLAIVVSALYRLHLYEEAFGFTRLRLFMNAFETWLGVIVGLLMVAGLRLQARWLPRAVVATAAVALLGLAAVNPDAFVARRNVERFEATGKVDPYYLQSLSADAVPAVDRLPEPLRSCALGGIRVADQGGLAGWNLGRERARSVLTAHPALPTVDCGAASPSD
jgi:uncharacterized protein DUF4153